MSDAKLWIDEVGCTATITGTNVSYTMPLWVLDVMRDIIGAEAEKKVEVTHRDFDTQQELLDRYKSENAKLRNEVDNLLDFEHLTSVAVAYAGCDECGEYKQTMLRLFAENAKLRERASEFWSLLKGKNEECPLALCPHMFECGGRCVYEDELRELGVEVDG